MSPELKKLQACFQTLTADQRQLLIDFAEFLVARQGPVTASDILPLPLAIERPETETVVAAIKRLSARYFMLDKPELLNETALLMSQHVLQGRDASQVIDDLETLFDHNYQQLLEAQDANSSP